MNLEFLNLITGSYFLDKDDGKGRQLDIKAWVPIENLVENLMIFINLLVECKKIPGNSWVFFQSPYRVETNCNCISVLDAFDWIPRQHLRFTYHNDLHFNNILTTTFYDEYILDVDNSNKREDNLFGSIVKISKATSFEIESQIKEFKNLMHIGPDDFPDYIVLYYPIIVFDGDLYFTNISRDTKNYELTPIDNLALYIEYVSGGYNIKTFIDIVKRQYFKKFLNSIIKDISVLKQTLESEITIEYKKEYEKAFDWYLSKK